MNNPNIKSHHLWLEKLWRDLSKTHGPNPFTNVERNVQAYVDDMVVTSEREDQHIADLEELFATIVRYNLKLNPDKCVFRVEVGKFLGSC